MKLKELKKYQRQNKEIIGEDTKGFSTLVSKYLKVIFLDISHKELDRND